MSVSGPTEKYSERADVFRSSPDSRHSRSRLARQSSGGTERFHSISNVPRMPHGECPAPRLSRLTRFYDLLAGWKLDRSLFIRYRPNGRFASQRLLFSNCRAFCRNFIRKRGEFRRDPETISARRSRYHSALQAGATPGFDPCASLHKELYLRRQSTLRP
jgi:hypothetical protein